LDRLRLFLPAPEHKSSPPQKQIEAECGNVNARIFVRRLELAAPRLP
jgi:hypothetical protein